MATRQKRLTFHPLTPDRWGEFETLFGPRGACAGCWCMWWRVGSAQFDRKRGSANKRSFKKIVTSGERPGIIALSGKEPVGWCAIAPRETYVRLERSRVLKPVDDQPVWSISCFFIAKDHRRKGVSVALLKAAVRFAKSQGARIVEGYPTDTPKDMPGPWIWTGAAAAFRRAGFREVARRSKTRPVMRFSVRGSR